jgi:hypothetical protein
MRQIQGNPPLEPFRLKRVTNLAGFHLLNALYIYSGYY